MAKELKVNPGALSALKHNQRQLDEDGTEVGVSRQALDEVLKVFDTPEGVERQQAIIKATIIGVQNTFLSMIETSTDLPPDPIGKVVVDVLQKAWRAGEDPINCIVVLTFQ